jgi:hypothetical protein
VQLLTDCLATFRLVRLVQTDEITRPARERLLDTLERRRLDRTAELVMCSWCLSVWVGFGVAIARRVVPRSWGLVADGLAASAVTGLLKRISETE